MLDEMAASPEEKGHGEEWNGAAFSSYDLISNLNSVAATKC